MKKWMIFREKWREYVKSPKRRLQLFLASLVIIYVTWVFLILNPMRTNKSELINKIQVLQSQLTDTQQRINTIKKAVKTESIAHDITEQNRLSVEIQNIQQVLRKIHLLLITAEEWIKLKKAIISQQDDMDSNITLKSINDLPVQPWTPTTVDKNDVMNASSHTIYQHALEVKFQADYFSALQYVSRLEKLPWHVYWDSLDYRVLTYPKAEVIIKFHIFSQRQSEV